MELVQLLEVYKDDILAEATRGLARAHLERYRSEDMQENERRLQRLYALIVKSIENRELGAIMDYARRLAQERFAAGYDLHEVQVAFNVLEEAIWRRVVREVAPSELAEALGLVSTVHGVAKDVLATTYVSLASKTKAPSLNLLALFEGSGQRARR